jgi:hypothetical protein
MAQKAVQEGTMELMIDGKKTKVNPDKMIPMTRPDGEPALAPAWRVKDLIYDKGFKQGYPKKKAAAK